MLATNTTPNEANASHAAGTWTYIRRCTSPWLASGGTTNRASTPASARVTAAAQPSSRWAPRGPDLASSRFTFFMSGSPPARVVLQRHQVVNEVVSLRLGELQAEGLVVVPDHRAQRGEPSVVVEAAGPVGAQARERTGAVHVRRRPVRLEAVDADVGPGVQVVARLREQRRHVAGRALRRAVEERPAALGGRGHRALARLRGRQGVLKGGQGGQLRRD